MAIVLFSVSFAPEICKIYRCKYELLFISVDGSRTRTGTQGAITTATNHSKCLHTNPLQQHIPDISVQDPMHQQQHQMPPFSVSNALQQWQQQMPPDSVLNAMLQQHQMPPVSVSNVLQQRQLQMPPDSVPNAMLQQQQHQMLPESVPNALQQQQQMPPDSVADTMHQIVQPQLDNNSNPSSRMSTPVPQPSPQKEKMVDEHLAKLEMGIEMLLTYFKPTVK